MNIEGLVIRRATVEDAAVMAMLKKKGWLATYVNKEHGITVEDIESEYVDDEKAIRHLKRWMEQDAKLKLCEVAEMDGGVVGFCLSQRDMDQQWHLVYLLHVATAHQRKGIGTKLLSRAIEWLGNDKGIILSVVAYNTSAISFYEKSRFKFLMGNFPRILSSGKHIPSISMARSWSIH